MSEEVEQGSANSTESQSKSGIAEPTRAAVRAAAAAPSDKWSVRRAELKRQKRRAHRRRIHASNTPG